MTVDMNITNWRIEIPLHNPPNSSNIRVQTFPDGTTKIIVTNELGDGQGVRLSYQELMALRDHLTELLKQKEENK